MRIRRSMRRRARPGQRGQALVETAIVLLVVMTLFVGVYACAVAISDSQQAGGASRSGARFAAQVGAGGYKAGVSVATGCQMSATDPCNIDNQILTTVLSGLNNGAVSDATAIVVTIYEPCADGAGHATCVAAGNAVCVNGAYTGSGAAYDRTADPGEVFTQQAGSTFTMAPAPTGLYDLSLRRQRHPTEAAVGVQVEMDYASPTPFVRVRAHLREFTINCLSPAA